MIFERRKKIERDLEGLKEELLTCTNPMAKQDIRQEIIGWEKELAKLDGEND